MNRLKKNAWFIKNPTGKLKNSIWFVYYMREPVFGKKRKEKWKKENREHWNNILKNLDLDLPRGVDRFHIRSTGIGTFVIYEGESNE